MPQWWRVCWPPADEWTSCLTREPWSLGATAPRLPFAASYQFVGQNERFQGALKLGRLGKRSQLLPPVQPSDQMGRDEGSPDSLSATL